MKIRSYLVYVLLLLLASANAGAYEFATGDFSLRPLIGESVNVVRSGTNTTREMPGAGLLLGLDGDYVIAQPWSLVAGIHPIFFPGFVDIDFLLGAKYRWLEMGTFVPYAGLGITTGVLVPTGAGVSEITLGFRASGGCDYFIMHNFAVGLELALEPRVGWIAGDAHAELAVDALIGFVWRL